MHRSPKARRVLPLALGCCLAAALLASVPGLAKGAPSKFTKESRQTYERQLAANEIRDATFNKRLRSLRLTLKDGRYVLYRYPRKGEPALAAQLKAGHVPVTILTSAQAKSEGSKAARHHKIRYIAGGILVAVIVIVGAVLLIDRRRKLAME